MEEERPEQRQRSVDLSFLRNFYVISFVTFGRGWGDR